MRPGAICVGVWCWNAFIDAPYSAEGYINGLKPIVGGQPKGMIWWCIVRVGLRLEDRTGVLLFRAGLKPAPTDELGWVNEMIGFN